MLDIRCDVLLWLKWKSANLPNPTAFKAVYTSLWQLHINGREPDLTPARFVMPPATGLHSNSWKPGERVYRESADLLYGMLEY